VAIRERNGRFEVVVYVGRTASGKRRSISRTTDSRRKAETLERQILRAQQSQRASDGSDATFGHLMDRWLDFARIEESTRYQARHQLDRHVRPVLGDVKVSRLRPEDLDELYRDLERTLAPSTVRRIHATVRSVLKLAVRWGWIARNPAEAAEPPPEGHAEPQAPDTAAVVALVDHLSVEAPELALFVWLSAVTGMRRGEVCALRRSDLDLDAGVVRVARALGLGKGKPYVKATKTGARHALAIDGETIDLLRLHLKTQDSTAAHYGLEVGDGFVFSHDVDCATPWRPDYASKQVRSLRGDVPAAVTLTLRDLRHWMITEALDGGASAKTTAGRVGHARTSTTTDRYAAFIPASDRDLAHALAARLAQARDM
jgi:integrase